jgi:hypothetical protein
MIWCTTVVTVSLLDKLGAHTDRPLFWSSCCGRYCCMGCRTLFPSVCNACGCWCWLSMQCSFVGLLWWGALREERPPRGFLGSSLCSSPMQFSFCVAASSVWRWMRFLSFYWGAIAATCHRFCINFFGAFPMQVVTTTPQTSRGLLAIGPDMARVLAFVELHEPSLSSVWFYLDNNMVKAIQLEYLLRFYVSC